jgi:hypothetical protein
MSRAFFEAKCELSYSGTKDPATPMLILLHDIENRTQLSTAFGTNLSEVVECGVEFCGCSLPGASTFAYNCVQLRYTGRHA